MVEDIKLDEVTATIAAQTITVANAVGTNVTLGIRDTDNIPVAVNQEMCPILIPRAANFVTDFDFMRDTEGADAAYKSCIYTLNYIFYFCPIGQGSTLFKNFQRMCNAAMEIMVWYGNHTTTITNGGAATTFLPKAFPVFSPVSDAMTPPTLFHGCVITFDVMKYLEV